MPITAPKQVNPTWQFWPEQQAMPLAPQAWHIPVSCELGISAQPSPALQVAGSQQTCPVPPQAKQRAGKPSRVVAQLVPAWQSPPSQHGWFTPPQVPQALPVSLSMHPRPVPQRFWLPWQQSCLSPPHAVHMPFVQRKEAPLQ
jgi:hypothetical protein